MASLTCVITPTLLSFIHKHPNLPKDSWYFITATTLAIINRPDEVPKVYKYAIEHGQDTVATTRRCEARLSISRRVREALVKASVVGGMPKSINALLRLKDATPDDLFDCQVEASPTRRSTDVYQTSVEQILQRGQSLFENIYGALSKRIMGQVDRVGAEDLGLTARLMYGYVLSNTNVLSPVETSFVLIAALIPQDVNPQLKGHLRGALNGGATVEEVRAIREVVIKICEASGMKRLDEDAAGGWGWRSEVANV